MSLSKILNRINAVYVVVVLSFMWIYLVAPVYAAPATDCTTNSSGTASTCSAPAASTPTSTEIGPAGKQIYTRLTEFINLLSGLVGILVVGSIIVGGIQYTTAGSDPQKVSSAKRRILNSIFAFLAFIFMYAFLQYLIPGGAF